MNVIFCRALSLTDRFAVSEASLAKIAKNVLILIQFILLQNNSKWFALTPLSFSSFMYVVPQNFNFITRPRGSTVLEKSQMRYVHQNIFEEYIWKLDCAMYN